MWLDKTVSLYKNHFDNTGIPANYRDILFCSFAKDINTIISLRKLDCTAQNYKLQTKPLKSKLQCYTPAALLACKAEGNVIEIHRTGIMQLDFDKEDICMYDLQELKACVFNLPFIGFCGLSCSGGGFYALALIAEPERLNEYAEHCFKVLLDLGIKVDQSKGKKVENLRYVSYDADMLYRENPTPLKLKPFKPKLATLTKKYTSTKGTGINGNSTLKNALTALQSVQSGHRWETVQKFSYTVGGLNNPTYLQQLINTIQSNPAFTGEETKYSECAKVCFNAGLLNPLKTLTHA